MNTYIVAGREFSSLDAAKTFAQHYFDNCGVVLGIEQKPTRPTTRCPACGGTDHAVSTSARCPCSAASGM